MRQLNEGLKIDVAMQIALNNTNATSRYFNLAEYGRALFVLTCGALAATKTCAIQLRQSTDGDGTSAKDITGKLATITANAKVSKATVVLASVANGEAIVINGVTFTAHTDTTTVASRQFKIDGNDAADAAALAGLINDATYGVAGVTATVNSATITLVVTDPGSTYLTISSAASTFTIATVEAVAFVEVDASDLDLAGGFSHVAALVTSTGNGTVGVTALRGDARSTPTQYVAASAA